MTRHTPPATSARGVSRQTLLDVSRRIIEDEGADHLTIRRLATEVDRTQPAVYQHFSSKEDLLRAVAIEGFEALLAQLERGAARAKNDLLQALVAAYVRFGLERPRLYRIMFVDPSTLAFGGVPATPAPARAAFGILARAVALECGIDARQVETATEVVWAALHGLVMLSIADRLRSGQPLRRMRLELLTAGVRTIATTAALPASQNARCP